MRTLSKLLQGTQWHESGGPQGASAVRAKEGDSRRDLGLSRGRLRRRGARGGQGGLTGAHPVYVAGEPEVVFGPSVENLMNGLQASLAAHGGVMAAGLP